MESRKLGAAIKGSKAWQVEQLPERLRANNTQLETKLNEIKKPFSQERS
jgi:hypothetical protein